LGRKTSHEVDLSLKEEDRVIVFHENIDEINDLFMSIDSPSVSIYHSQFPSSLNKIGLELYQRNATRVLLSVKALIEGIDVPSTNLGIIMASSSSRVQRVQSLGRILRKAEGKDETNLVIVYVHNTTDERIYQNTNWDALVGEGRVGFRQWSEFGELEIEDPGIKFQRKEEEKDVEVNEDELVPGGLYPGRYDGGLLSFDSRGKLFVRKENTREYLDIDTNGLWGLFRTNKPTGGSFKINKNGHVLIAIKDAEGWRRQFLGYAKDYNLVNYIPEAEAK
jgi:superfamily II DNA or RNA helicase